jgi:hypothetical protein
LGKFGIVKKKYSKLKLMTAVVSLIVALLSLCAHAHDHHGDHGEAALGDSAQYAEVEPSSEPHPHYIEWSDDMKRAYVSMPRSGVSRPKGYVAPTHTCVHDAVAKSTTTLVDPQVYVGDNASLPHGAKRQTNVASFTPFRVVFDFQFLGGVRCGPDLLLSLCGSPPDATSIRMRASARLSDRSSTRRRDLPTALRPTF